MNQPYTYSRLVNFIEKTQEVPRELQQLRSMEIKTLGYSISNNIIPAVKITRPERKNKEAILILGRQHPCETVGSFIGEEMMRFMMQDNPISSFLLNTYDFIILPMVNPDGVIHGSSRCNMAGLDLNRQWGEGSIKVLVVGM